MKKLMIVGLVLMLLSGCTSQETIEQVSDVWVPETPEAREVSLSLPEDASAEVMEKDNSGKLYMCDGYTVSLYTTASGDLDKTLREFTGFSKDSLQVIETKIGKLKRYDCVWSAAGEGDDQINRMAILDDGNYHYVLTATGNVTAAKELNSIWQKIFNSFALKDTAG